MLRTGIPAYRLPREDLAADIRTITDMGVSIRTGVRVGEDVAFDDLRREYDAVFVAAGAHKSRPLGVDGQDAKGVFRAMEFLAPANLGDPPPVKGRVAVIGGGNSAVDAARVAVRTEGVDAVAILYRRTRQEMPAYEEEIEAALEEGVTIEYLTAPLAVRGRGGAVAELELIRMELGEPDASGRRRPVPVEGSEYRLPFDAVISAIGETPDLSFAEKTEGLGFTKWGSVEADPLTLETGVPGVFAGGDAVTGPATVVEAVGAGKIAADTMDQYLRGQKVERRFFPNRARERVPPFLSQSEDAPPERAREAHIPAAERAGVFTEVVRGLDSDVAVREARRCFRCDL